jgi:hypothetical protein
MKSLLPIFTFSRIHIVSHPSIHFMKSPHPMFTFVALHDHFDFTWSQFINMSPFILSPCHTTAHGGNLSSLNQFKKISWFYIPIKQPLPIYLTHDQRYNEVSDGKERQQKCLPYTCP